MQISPYVPTATQIKEAVPFTNFDTQLFVKYDSAASEALDKDYYVVERSFRFYLSETQSNVWGYVPAGYLTDGASVPRPLWWLVPPWGVYGQAAVLHDILCETGTMFKDEVPYQISRADADELFLNAMKASGVNTTVRWVMFIAVRLWGIFGWRTDPNRIAKKRELESEYMKAYGTYREPTAVLRQVTKALTANREVVLQAQ